MRLPQPLLDSPCFLFSSVAELSRAMGDDLADEEHVEMLRLAALGLPPITSTAALATMIGINQGLLWSLLARPRRYYRTFWIPKGSGSRRIDAPKIALKIIQKWLACQIAATYQVPKHVFGFVQGRSHVDAAKRHLGCKWVLSLDIENFFPSTTEAFVVQSLERAGYSTLSAKLLSRLMCLDGGLAQGAPTSPVMSNICCHDVDRRLEELSVANSVCVTRYADDVTFSGVAAYPENLLADAKAVLEGSPWITSDRKTSFATAPSRLKVHGLLVDGDKVRLTKGYRNRLRAFRHLLVTRQLDEEDSRMMRGHLAYGDFVREIEPGGASESG